MKSVKNLLLNLLLLASLLLGISCSGLSSNQIAPSELAPPGLQWTATDSKEKLLLTLAITGLILERSELVTGEISLRNISRIRRRIYIPGIVVFLSLPASSTLPVHNPLIKNDQEYVWLSPGESISYKFKIPFRVDELFIHAAYQHSQDARQYLIHERWALTEDSFFMLRRNFLPEE